MKLFQGEELAKEALRWCPDLFRLAALKVKEDMAKTWRTYADWIHPCIHVTRKYDTHGFACTEIRCIIRPHPNQDLLAFLADYARRRSWTWSFRERNTGNARHFASFCTLLVLQLVAWD